MGSQPGAAGDPNPQSSLDLEEINGLIEAWQRLRERISAADSRPAGRQRLIGDAQSLLEQIRRQGAIAWEPADRQRLRAAAQEIGETLRRLGGGVANPDILPNRIPVAYPGRLPLPSTSFVNREEEKAQLTRAWDEGRYNILALRGFGGVGKSLLVRHWMEDMRQTSYRGADAVFAWCFEGDRGDASSDASEDLFFSNAGRYFKIDPSKRSMVERAQALLSRLQERKVLLVLDGVEAIQRSTASERGRLRNETMRDFLRGLAEENPGLCMITTRFPLVDLAHLDGYDEWAVEGLSAGAATRLLEAQSVRGERAELAAAAIALRGHALTLTLLAAYLKRHHDGDIGHWREALDPPSDGEDPALVSESDRLQATLTFYGESLLSLRNDTAEGRLLGTLGLFERVAFLDEIESVWPIVCPKLLDDAQLPALEEVLERLMRLGIATRADEEVLEEQSDHGLASRARTRIDAHPSLRRELAERLRKLHPTDTRQAHDRLYRRLLALSVGAPETLEGMVPLYWAIHHGCEAGHHLEAFQEVYVARIHRGDHYAWTHIGAFSTELAALACFFVRSQKVRWSRPVETFKSKPVEEARLLSAAGYCLRALGRLDDADEPMAAAVRLYEKHKRFERASAVAGSLCELAVTRGQLHRALVWGRRALKNATLSQDLGAQRSKLARIGDVWHQRGRFAKAIDELRNAEETQARLNREIPFLHTLSGFYHHDLLLDIGSHLLEGWARRLRDLDGLTAGDFHYLGIESDGEASQAFSAKLVNIVCTRAERVLAWAEEKNHLLECALAHLILGRARLLQQRLQDKADRDYYQVSMDLHQALKAFELADQRQELPRGLIARAGLRRELGNYAGAETDLNEARAIAERHRMPLFLCDTDLERVRLSLALKQPDEADARLQSVKKAVEALTHFDRPRWEIQALELEIEESRRIAAEVEAQKQPDPFRFDPMPE